MPQPTIFQPGSDLSKVPFEIGDPNIRFQPWTQELTQQALDNLRAGLLENSNTGDLNTGDPNWLTIRMEQHELFETTLQAIINAHKDTCEAIKNCMPNGNNV
jgi:hypothetical protein